MTISLLLESSFPLIQRIRSANDCSVLLTASNGGNEATSRDPKETRI